MIVFPWYRAHNCHYEPCPFYARKGMLQRFNFAVFSRGDIKRRSVSDTFGTGNAGSPSEELVELQALIPMSWDAVTHNKQIWGYPIALEAVSLIYNKKFDGAAPPAQLSEARLFAKELRASNPNVIAIM
jgi:hypothetical protein